MARSITRPVAAVGLVAALLAYIGCGQPSSTKDAAADAPTNPLTKPPAVPDSAGKSKLFANWPTPAGALVISGEQDGYLEPCGCTQGQQGGLTRRYDLAERLKAQSWPLALIDLGSLIKDPAGSRGGPEESKFKFMTALQALSTMNYDALALSAEDLKLGVGEVLGQFLNNMGERTKVVVANVEVPGFEGNIKPSLRLNAGKARIGVTAVLDPDALNKLADPEKDTLLKVKTVAESLPGVLADLEKDTDFQVLMVQGPPELAKTLAEAHPGFDVVVGTSHFDPKEDPELLNQGRTMLISVGKKGKYVGVVGFFPNTDKPMRYMAQALNSRFNGPAEAMKKVVQDDFRDLLKINKIVESFPRHHYANAPQGAAFVGADACKSCHPATFAKWSTTKHARGYDSLVTDPKPNTVYDAECVTCHTTGFEYNSGWVSAEATPHLKGNQCENCHGPASKHIESPDDRDARKFLALTAERADQTHMCLRCHDEDNSPHFKFETHYGQIAHKGMDTYTDPKVHQGSTPKVARRPGP
ncbi:MAG: multiheme c-type cytochrome [Isosphaeraceae bacterium]|nr:multiheme c-type cytochrome [Isosphaeraceae bacterium]